MFFFVLNKWDESLYSYIVVNRILYYLLKHEFRFLICSPPMVILNWKLKIFTLNIHNFNSLRRKWSGFVDLS